MKQELHVGWPRNNAFFTGAHDMKIHTAGKGRPMVGRPGWSLRNMNVKTNRLFVVVSAVAALGASAALTAQEMPVKEQRKEFTISQKYLIVPVQNKGGQNGNLKLTVDGRIVLDLGMALASGPDKADWYAFFEIDRYKGGQAGVVASKATDAGFALVKQSDTIPGGENFYKEKLRPQFHFTSKTGWLNDPNGMIYYKGEYHLYYQHNPVGLPWGNMSWGHAVSKDMVHWKEQPKVLFPEAKSGTCFSGAAFIDRNNQLGLKTGPEDVLVMFYLRTKIGLCYAYSNDRGYTLTDYEGNPVLTHKGDRIDTPRPFWYEPTKRWIAPTYDFHHDEKGKKFRCVGFYSSENLKNWTYESRVDQPDGKHDELCGCVDFFELPVDGDARNKKWVMILIDGSYIIGTFDGHRFYTLAGKPATTDDRERSLVIKGNYYATMTWENDPAGRRVQLTWMQGGKYPGMPFNQQMTVPSELTLHATKDGPRLRMNPIEELKSLRTKTHQWKDVVLKAGDNPLAGITGDLFDLEVEFVPAADSETIISMRGIKTVYDSKTQTLSACGINTKLEPIDGAIRLRMLLDRTSLEVYGNDGRVYIPCAVIPDETQPALTATAGRGEIKARLLRVHELKSIWE
jgi:fructan beta-fructosidase